MTSPRRGGLVPRLAAAVAVLATSVGLAVPARAASAVSAAPLALPAATTTTLAAESPAAPGVTFALRPAGAKAIDARTTWTYRDVKPGQQWIDHLAVENYSNQAATFSVYAVDAYNGTSGGYELLRREDKQRGVGTWIELGTHTVTVPARKAVLLPFRFHVPRRVEPGDHGGGIVATYRSTRTDTKGNAVTVESRVGTRMYVRIAGTLRPSLAVEKTSAAWLGAGFPRGSARVTWTVHNTGNVRLEGTQSVRIRGLLGKGVVASEVPDLTELLPGGSVTFSTRVDHVWPLLFHTATVVVDPRSVVGNVDPALEQASARIRFLSPLWLWIALAVLLAGATWWFLARRRRRRAAPGAPSAGPSGPSTSTPAAPAPDRVIVLPEDRTPARTLRTLGVAVLVGLVGALVPLGPGTAPAHAAADELTFLPAKGADTTPMYAVTSGPCPQATLGVIGRMYGAGLPADGTIVVPNTQAGIRTDTAFGVPLQDSLYGLATTLNVTFRGRYQVVVACIDELGTRTYAQFRGVLTFPSPHQVVGRAPARPPAYGVPVPYMTDTFPELKKLVAAPSPTPSASAPGGLPPAASAPGVPSQRSGEADAQAGGRAAAATPSPADGGSPLPFVVVGLALLVAAGGMWAWGRRPVPVPASVAWDDGPVAARDAERSAATSSGRVEDEAEQEVNA